MMAALMAVPFPAENTPECFIEYPSQSLMMARAVASPTPAGKASSHHFSSQANERWNLLRFPWLASRAWDSMMVCSVSSLHIPLPSRKW